MHAPGRYVGAEEQEDDAEPFTEPGPDPSGGRHLLGPALRTEDRVGEVAWPWPASPHSAGPQPGFSSLNRGYRPEPLCDFRMYDKPVGGMPQNEHWRDRVTAAYGRGMQPAYVLCDSGYRSLDHLKPLCPSGWAWLTQLQSHRRVDSDGRGHVAIRDRAIAPQGPQVHLRESGFVRVCRTVADNGRAAYGAGRDLNQTPPRRQELALPAWALEDYPRGLKPGGGVGRAQVCSARAHMGCVLRTALRLEYHRLHTGLSGYAVKEAIVCSAVSPYLANPFCTILSTA